MNLNAARTVHYVQYHHLLTKCLHCHACNNQHISFRSDAFRCLLTPSPESSVQL